MKSLTAAAALIAVLLATNIAHAHLTYGGRDLVFSPDHDGGDGDLPGDFAQLSSLNYKGSAAATSGANTVTGILALPAGDYTFL